MPDFEPSSSATYFHLPSSFRWLMIVYLVALLGFIALFLTLAIFEPGRKSLVLAAIDTAGCGAFGLLVAGIIRKSWDRVAVDDAGVWYLPYKASPVLLRWKEIASVEAREIRKRLILSDASGFKKIKLEYELKNFDKLREVVLARTTASRAHTPACSVFHRNYVNRGFQFSCILLFAACASLALRSGQPKAGTLLVAFAGICFFYPLLREPSKITISPLSLRIDYFGWYRVLPFDTLTNIEFVTVRGRDVSAAVLIKNTKSRAFTLMGFQGGSVVLYDSLRAAWLASRAGKEIPLTATSYAQQPARSTAPQPADGSSPTPRVFHGKASNWLFPVLVVVCSFAASLSYWRLSLSHGERHGIAIAALCLLLSVAAGFFLLAIVPRRLTVSDDSVAIVYLWRRRVVPYAAIANIEMTWTRNANGAAIEMIRLDRVSGAPLSIGGFKEDPSALYEVLRTAWSRSRTHHALANGQRPPI
jgi:hypothetical protein